MKELQDLLKKIGFLPKENTDGIYEKTYSGSYVISVDFKQQKIIYGNKIVSESKTTQNFSQAENFVVLECVDRLLQKGYLPENIILEKTWAAGHGTSGRLDICVTREDGSEYLLIECKTFGKEFEKEFTRMKKDGGQLFTYFKFSNKPDIIMLYASELRANEIIYRNEIVKIENDYRIGDKDDFYEKWNKLTKDNGVFENWVNPYSFESKALTINDLEEIRQEDSSFIFNRFLEILRHNVVSDKGNAFNRIFTLFLCKIYDEKINEGTDNELGFQWLEGIDDHRSFQLRLTDLYKSGMHEFLEKVATDFSETEFKNRFPFLSEEQRNPILEEFRKIRLEKNNEFAIKDVYDEQSFNENAVVVKEIVELLQKFKLRYTKKQQYLSDFFELLLTTGLKQESGQFFTPVPVAQFVIKSLPIDTILEEKLSTAKIDNDTLLPYVMDYAAGSGHFLTETMHEMQRLIKQKDDKKYNPSVAKKIRNWQDDHFAWAIQYVYGIEKDYRLVKVGKVGCYLHGDGLANVIHSDGLARFTHPDYKGKLLQTDKDFPTENKQFDIIVSNPPYSVSAFKNNARSFYKEDQFELYDKLTDNSSEIECLFIERTKQLLKDRGVAGIILPSSILNGTSVIYEKTRELILNFFEVIAITELGGGTFMATNTKTVTLFLRRRNNYDSINLKIAIEKLFASLQDVTLNGIEKPIAKYLNHVWEGVSFENYLTLLKKEPNKAITEHEIYTEYRKKLNVKNDKEFWAIVFEREAEKIFYFILAYPQKVVLVKSGEKDAEKRFLGYEFSNSRRNEGIHPIKGNSIEDCTRLFDSERFDNPKKASTYIYKAFQGDFDFSIDESLLENVSRHNLVDFFTFDRVNFNKNFTLSARKKIKIESKWPIFKLNQLINIVRGASPRPIRNYITDNADGINWIKIGDVKPDSKFITETKEKITIQGAEKSRFVRKGDFILSNSMSFGRPYILDIEGCIHDGWLLLNNFSKNLNKDYLYYMLSSTMIQDQFTSAASGGTSVDNLNIEKVAYTQIPLPTIEIQEKLVQEIIDLEKKSKTIVIRDLDIQIEKIIKKYLL
ncbi:MAG: N-6 DNA methylase [Flavobacteriia bacterium]|nr:N-6 DNA methylase [Flavobacteriia bacterium]